MRPKDGINHPDLDEAWVEYDAAVARAAEGIKAAIAKQFNAATAQGDLDAAEKWAAIGEAFDKTGEIATEKETYKAVQVATDGFNRAKDALKKAYDEIIKTLTKDKKIDDAKSVRAEWQSLSVGHRVPPKPNEWVSIFDGQSKEGWGNSWGQDAEIRDGSLRLGGERSGLTHLTKQPGDVAFEAEVTVATHHGEDPVARMGVCVGEKGAYYLEADGRGFGKLVMWDQIHRTYREITRFRCPTAAAGEWQTWQLQRVKGHLRAVIDGKEVVDVEVPKDGLPDGRIQVATRNADVGFRSLRVKQLR